MSTDTIALNDGTSIPLLAYGTAGIPRDGTADQIALSIKQGFRHIDTAQNYGNEGEAGQGVLASRVPRDQIHVTTKWSFEDREVVESCEESLAKMGLDYVDLYLIHQPTLCGTDIRGAWAKMEEVHRRGYAKRIGVSNFSIGQLKAILDDCKVKPVVNQIKFNPWVYEDLVPLLDFMKQNDIVAEGFTGLKPLRHPDGPGPVSAVAHEIAKKHGRQPEQVLLAWMRQKGAIPITKSSQRDRMSAMLQSTELVLDEAEIKSIEVAGADEAPSRK